MMIARRHVEAMAALIPWQPRSRGIGSTSTTSHRIDHRRAVIA